MTHEEKILAYELSTLKQYCDKWHAEQKRIYFAERSFIGDLGTGLGDSWRYSVYQAFSYKIVKNKSGEKVYRCQSAFWGIDDLDIHSKPFDTYEEAKKYCRLQNDLEVLFNEPNLVKHWDFCEETKKNILPFFWEK